MRKLFSIFTIALISAMAMAQNPVIVFERTEHNFGQINEQDGRVTTEFVFKNEGMSPLVLSNVRASCGCTTPKWTREPIEPGQSGQITVTYNPSGRPGRFQKTITVTSNATEATTRLYIKGEVIPKPAAQTNTYSVHMGDLDLKSKTINFGVVKKGDIVEREIEYANNKNANLLVNVATNLNENYLQAIATLETVKPKETGKLKVVFNSDMCKTYGPITMYAYVVVNGKQTETDDFKITISADVQEDFSNMTVEEKQMAPIIDVDNKIDLGVLNRSNSVKKTITLTNAGFNPLTLHRVYSSTANIKISTAKSSIKSGKKGEIKLDINTLQQEAGDYTCNLIIISNDPTTPRKEVTIKWTVQ